MENIDSLVQVEVERRLSDPVFLQNAFLGRPFGQPRRKRVTE
jgi:hypothetical protein